MEENKLRNEAEEQVEITVERKLVELYTLQQIDSKIDKIRIIRGELPLKYKIWKTKSQVWKHVSQSTMRNLKNSSRI